MELPKFRDQKRFLIRAYRFIFISKKYRVTETIVSKNQYRGYGHTDNKVYCQERNLSLQCIYSGLQLLNLWIFFMTLLSGESSFIAKFLCFLFPFLILLATSRINRFKDEKIYFKDLQEAKSRLDQTSKEKIHYF